MKICFFLQRRWVLIGHSLAFHLKKSFPDTEFCAVVQMRPSLEFLQKQEDIPYTSFLMEEDVHKKLFEEKIDHNYLSWLEEEYGIPNLWPYVYVDRIIMSTQLVREYPHDKALLSHEEMIKRIQVTAKAIIEFLDRERPDVLVISVIGSVSSLLLYHIAKKRGIKTINVELTRIHNRIAYSEDYRTFTGAKKCFDEIEGGRKSHEAADARKFIDAFRKKPSPYHQQALPTYNNQVAKIASVQFLHPRKLAWSVYWHGKTFLNDLRKRKNKDYTDVFVWWIIWDKAKRKTRSLIGYSDLYCPVDHNERFAFYPLHFDPETATMLYAPRYTDQIHLIKQIARSLPLDMKLYVKEHAAMVGYRKRSYYKEIRRIPNVKLISPHINGHELVQSARLITTISGTGGWEGVLLKKPVITFGDVFYNDLPGVKRCRSFEDLPFLVKEQLGEWKHNEEQLVNYVSALLEESVPVDYIDLWIKAESIEKVIDNEGIKKLADALAEKIGLNNKSDESRLSATYAQAE